MLVECRSCTRRDLKDRTCFAALLRAFANEPNVDKIVLSNHVETEYFGKALAILKGITALSYEMNCLSKRVPADYTGRIPKGCAECPFRPDRVFGPLNEQFLSDVGLFYSLLHNKTVELFEQEVSNCVCGECQMATREDFDYISSRFESLLREIVKEGYAVVV
jgi:hypothetical protein